MELGRKLRIRSIVNIASEVIPYFWPMRNFVHHNPLHELEVRPFTEAVKEGERIFGGRGYLSREEYIQFLTSGKISKEQLKNEIKKFLEGIDISVNINLEEAIYELMTDGNLYPYSNLYLYEGGNVDNGVVGFLKERFKIVPEYVCSNLLKSISYKYTLYDVVDLLKGTEIADIIDELTIKAVISFLDEGQSVIGMPKRENGFFKAWRELALRNWRYIIRTGRGVEKILGNLQEPEEVIDYVLKSLKLPEELWEGYITLELAKLKGIVGFIRWRSHNKNYYWQIKYPIDVVDYTAVRLILAKAVMDHIAPEISDYESLSTFLIEQKERAFLMYEYNSGEAVRELVEEIPYNFDNPYPFLDSYLDRKAEIKAINYSIFLSKWLSKVEVDINALGMDEIMEILDIYERFCENEGYIWLNALEETFIEKIIGDLHIHKEEFKEDKHIQALFCIDVRSERFRRNLEKVGNYQTYGIAGFFGIPMAFVELTKGHEEYLCPVLIKPRNVVIEVPRGFENHTHGYSHIVEEILHDLKQNVFTPYITVEAIGFLFGFDFIGKTFFPLEYSKVRENVTEAKLNTDILIDKLSREEMERIVNTVYEISVRKILKHELNIKEDKITGILVEEIVNVALEGGDFSEKLSGIGIDVNAQRNFFDKLRNLYKIERGYRDLTIERLKNIGFSDEEKANLLANALQAIGLTEDFATLILVVGHGSKSDNNPYESALDCGACGGAAGIHNARVFCKIANDNKVREILKTKFGIDIPEETVFIPALHNTTTDEVTLHDLEYIPTKLNFLTQRIKEDLEKARLLSSSERYSELFGDIQNKEYIKIKDIEKNAYDWSQVRPEWGLSGNFAFIIGERYLTEKANFGGKVFLHSYNYKIDKRGFLLETILSGPLIVGEWINMEHYFSSTDNEVYGSGSKVYHNVVCRLGVMSGNLSDIRTGLPAQTVLKGKLPFHNPVRLIVLISAPFDFALSVINRIYKIRELIKNRWINVIIFDPERRMFYRYRDGEWIEIEKMEVQYEGA